MNIQGSQGSRPIDDIHLQRLSPSGESATESLQLPKNAGTASKKPLKNAAQLSTAPNKAVSETAAHMEKVTSGGGTLPKNKTLGRKIGNQMFAMQHKIGSATPKSNDALVITGRVLAAVGGGLLYGTGLIAGAAINLTLSVAAGLVGIGLSIVSTVFVGGFHLLDLNPESSWKAFQTDRKQGVNLALQASGALRGEVRDKVFSIAQCIPLALTALGAGLLEFGGGKYVDSRKLTTGMIVANRDLATYIQKYFPDDSHASSASKASSVSEESHSSEKGSRSESEFSETDTRNRSASGFNDTDEP